MPRSGSSAVRAALSLILAAMLGSGCTPTCEQTCRKLVRCDAVETVGLTVDECTADCQLQEDLYDYWEDPELVDALDASRECVRDNECADIADGVCYDEELYPY